MPLDVNILREGVRAWAGCCSSSESEGLLSGIKKENPSISRPHLEYSRILSWRLFDSRDPNLIISIYNLLDKNSDIAFPLEAFADVLRYEIKSLDDVKRFFTLARRLIPNTSNFNSGEYTTIGSFNNYDIKLHRLEFDFGVGIICTSLVLGNNKIAQISFYPSNPLIVFEIKGGRKTDSFNPGAAIDSFTRRFNINPFQFLLLQLIKSAHENNADIKMLPQVSGWRNYGMTDNEIARGTRRHQSIGEFFNASQADPINNLNGDPLTYKYYVFNRSLQRTILTNLTTSVANQKPGTECLLRSNLKPSLTSSV